MISCSNARFEPASTDVWASITESERTARWFASWTGDAGPGKTIRYRLEFEEGKPEAICASTRVSLRTIWP